ncbi:MAG TPA: sodium:proton antiporter [Candidatus Cybelea sp.]|nr:sodium:proton antiporter [Candidatus Cybelea sp.]
MKLWQILAVVALGVVYGLIQPGRLEYAFGHATLYVFLPALLFEAAWNLNFRAMRRQWIPIATLAGPGVLLTAAIVAGALSLVRVPLGAALLTGAILSATDPVAVVAVFRRLPVPRTLATIVECESLFNDAVAVVLYRAVLTGIALGAASAGAIALVTLQTIAASIGGVALGIALAFVVAGALQRAAGVPALQIAATLTCAYGIYFAADYLHLSGIFATIAYGIALRYYERASITLTIAREVERFWDVVALLANVAVFFLAGAALELSRLTAVPAFTIAALAGVAISRFAVASLLCPGAGRRAWRGVVRVAGMRGALSLALALALPATIPLREAIVDATFAVVLATLVVSSLALDPVVRRASLRQTPSG